MSLAATLKTRVTRAARNATGRSSWNAARLISGSCLPFTTFPAQIAETVRSLQVPTRLHFDIFA
ncbi:hypothetical protein EAG_06957 [Camponotus floridanus]|uniref:Uncharacterized protein n=1 Tax=Camponotus floridanus TaxID=104421 RepID=E2APA5_CAMFO|nr:hypothetical protein EAG_06957 [Camponotus floridanus]